MLSATCAACGFMWLYHQAKVTTDHPWINVTIFQNNPPCHLPLGHYVVSMVIYVSQESPSPYLDQISPINTNKHVISELYAHILAQRFNSHVVFKTSQLGPRMQHGFQVNSQFLKQTWSPPKLWKKMGNSKFWWVSAPLQSFPVIPRNLIKLHWCTCSSGEFPTTQKKEPGFRNI